MQILVTSIINHWSETLAKIAKESWMLIRPSSKMADDLGTTDEVF